VYDLQLHEFVDKRKSRYVAEQGNRAAAKYIGRQFEAMGLKTSEQDVRDSRIRTAYTEMSLLSGYEADKHTNVIGFLQGSDLAHEVVLLGAHYDSINLEDLTGPAPGVDDNGSGMALLLTVAKTLTGAKFKPRRSIAFVAFNAEEEGLVGSEHFAKVLSEGGKELRKYGNLSAAFIADEVAFPGRRHERRAIFETLGHSQGTTSMVDTLAHLAQLRNATSDVAGDGIGDGAHNFVVNYNGFGSDHISFLNRGFPAVLLIERDDDWHADTYGHSDRDTFDHVDLSYGAAMSRLALRAVASFANPIAKAL
jgi:Zn-dependent M28 family amino/carboxypeptidase